MIKIVFITSIYRRISVKQNGEWNLAWNLDFGFQDFIFDSFVHVWHWETADLKVWVGWKIVQNLFDEWETELYTMNRFYSILFVYGNSFILVENVRIFENPRNHLEIFEIIWKSLEIVQKSLETIWKSLEIFEIIWKSLKSLEIFENHLEIFKIIQKSLEIIWKSLEIQENHLKIIQKSLRIIYILPEIHRTSIVVVLNHLELLQLKTNHRISLCI